MRIRLQRVAAYPMPSTMMRIRLKKEMRIRLKKEMRMVIAKPAGQRTTQSEASLGYSSIGWQIFMDIKKGSEMLI
ncbi:hypothetical protein Tco_1283084 [Tanacetum coccineum]